ncbi:MAG: TIGR04255 family protein, partial [Gaiellaceae bacterium]
FVAFEVRIPTTPDLAGSEGPLPAFERLRDILPIIGPPQIMIDVKVEGGAPPAIMPGPLRILDRRRVLSALIGPNAIIIENSDYERYEAFIEVVERTLRAVTETASIAGMERVGLRYIDEIRVPGLTRAREWHGYISPALLGPLELDEEFEAVGLSGMTEYRLSDEHAANVRFGARVGRVVEPSGPLRVTPVEDGPFFLVDIDSFWTAPEAETPEFSPEAVLETCAQLRRPIRALFEAAITDKLRDEVLRRAP